MYNTAPTVMAPAAFACPTTVPVPRLFSLMVPSPLKIIYLNRTLPVPLLRVMIILAPTVASTTNGITSNGSPPMLFLLKPNRLSPLAVTRYISKSFLAPVAKPQIPLTE